MKPPPLHVAAILIKLPLVHTAESVNKSMIYFFILFDLHLVAHNNQ